MADEADEGPKPTPRARPNKPPAVGPGNEPAAAISPAQATQAGEGMVAMIFTKEIVLTDDKHTRIRFPIGLVNVPAHLADHWYLKANGATRASDEKPQEPAS